jgi:cob(I)alamin adenosyltransferase
MGKFDEVCYTFMPEKSMFCDFEVLTDGLSSYLGLVHSIAKQENYPRNLQEDVLWLCEMSLHVNGSLRGKLAVEKEDLEKLHKLYQEYQADIKIKHFTLPTGSYLSCQINIARHKAKEVVRLLNKIHREEKEVPSILFSFTNLLANFLYILSLYVNILDKEENKLFTSKSYELKI